MSSFPTVALLEEHPPEALLRLVEQLRERHHDAVNTQT